MAVDTKLQVIIDADNRRLQAALLRSQKQVARFKARTSRSLAFVKAQFSGIAAPLLAGGALSVGIGYTIRTLADFEKQMSKVKAISGASAIDMERFSKQAIEIASTTKFSAIEIGKMQEEFARLGKTVPEIIAAGEAISDLALVADTELGEAAKVMASTLNAFNLEATESERVANTMAESFTKSSLDMEKFTTAIGNVGAGAAAAGYDLEQTTAMLGVLTDSGIDASKAGTDLRKIFTELSSKGISLKEALSEIRSATDKVGKAKELFGQRALVAGIILAENEIKTKGLTEALRDNNKELSTMVDIMESNLSTEMAKFGSAIESIVVSAKGSTGVMSEFVASWRELLNLLSSQDVSAIDKLLLLYTSPFTQKATKEQEAYNKSVREFNEGLASNEQTRKDRLAGLRFYNIAVKDGIKDVDSFKKAHAGWAGVMFASEGAIANLAERLKKDAKERQDLLDLEIAKGKKLLATKEAEALAEKKITDALNKRIATAKEKRAEGVRNDRLNQFIGGFEMEGLGVGRSIQEQLDESITDLAVMYNKKNGIMTQAEADTLLHTENMKEIWGQFAEDIQLAIEGALVGIGVAFASGGDIGSAVAPLLNSMGDALIRMGFATKAWSDLMEKLKTSLLAGIDGGISGGAAAGIAIAAGIALKATASRIGSSTASGGGIGGGGSSSGRFQGSARGQSVNIQGGEFIVRGSDLVYVLNKENGYRNRGNG